MKPGNVFLVATLVFLPGCASQRVLMTPEDRLWLSSQPHIITIHYPPEETFTMDTGAASAGALAIVILGPLVGGAVAVAGAIQQEAARREQERRLDDPALRVKDRLVNAFQLTNVRTPSEYPRTMTVALETYSETLRNRPFWASREAWAGTAEASSSCTPSPGVTCSPPDEDRVRFDSALKEAFGTGVVLEVQTRRWRLEHNVSRVRLVYSARARLLRLADSAVMWQATCAAYAAEVRASDVPNFAERMKPHPTIGQPRADELMIEELGANDGKLLKAKLLEAAGGCADRLARSAVGKVSSPNR
jgi:hypothetical protein